jgi:hypothetical protein|tara:strand:+ start:3864 stop:4160 length:297 start_codon:yes stop_codon:yes gene_type:complete
MKNFYLISLLTIACSPPMKDIDVKHGYMCNAANSNTANSDIFFIAFEETDEPGFAILETATEDIWLELKSDSSYENPFVDEVVTGLQCSDIINMKYVK